MNKLLPTLALVLLVATNTRAHDVGVASVDITPDYNVRLNGFGHRKTESDGVTARIHAKALAFRDANQQAAVLLTVDSLGVPDYMTSDVAARLKSKANLDPTRFAVTSTHTHTAPALTNCCPNIQGAPFTTAEQEKIDRYTKELADKLEQVALAALKDLKPATIEYGVGTHALAKNRRTPGGPVDHDLPVMAIRDPATKNLRAVYLSYACHCVTLSHMKISGDWAGYAADAIEKTNPGVIALTSIGCGADSNPQSDPVGDKVEVAVEQGNQLAAAVDRVIKSGGLSMVDQPIATNVNRITLEFDKPPTREQFEEIAKKNPPYQGYYAKVQLAKLDRGEKLQTQLSYPIQTWTFGDHLAMVFLPGEVVVDYSLRLKKEFDRSKIWINAYSNDVPCYIASERVLKEGGYEVDSSMWFYDRPARLASGVEKKIVDEVHRQLPKTFVAPQGTEGVAPKTPEQSLRSMRTRDDLEIALVAAEPQLSSPIAIDWSPDGRLYVCEMFDYPTGADGNWKPGGRVRILEDADHDGRYEKSTIFLENIPFPTGVTAYARGVIVCAAPDILFAQDTNNDGKADKVEKLFSGFATDNYQARVNSISLGLDNWLYAGNGLLGGLISPGQARGFSPRSPSSPVDIRNRDFRFRFPNGPLETVEGLTQFGRVRDDFATWFGCDNSNPILFYPHEERYLRRNPHAPAPPAVVRPKTDYDLARVYPISRTLERFNDPTNVNRVTSACGLALYRDELMPQLAGNAFYCEPVHNLVSRMILSSDDAGFRVSRDAGEKEREFLASSDNWFRPTQVRSGPDGALYVVDMYRFLIEHPRWIPAERLAQLDIRAGADRGRIYRVRARGAALREIRDLTKMSLPELVAALDTPNGTERDRVHMELITREEASGAREPLEKLASDAKAPQVRVQALAALDGLDAVVSNTLIRAIKDPDERVRAFAVRLYENAEAQERGHLLALVADPSRKVRRQLAYTLGEWDDARAAAALANLALSDIDDAETRIAVLSSAPRASHCGAVLDAIAASTSPARDAWLPPLVATAAALDDADLLKRALAAVTPTDGEKSKPSAAQFVALGSLLEALDRKGASASSRDLPHLAAARRVAADAGADPATREAAVRVLGRGSNVSDEELTLLCDLVARGESSEKLRDAALAALRRQQSPAVAKRLLDAYPTVITQQRALVISLLLERDEWTAALLDAVEQRKVAATEISLTDRQRLFESPSDSIRARAQKILPPLSAGKRDEIVARYATVKNLIGVARNGAELFAKNCAACHAFDGVGHDVGPNLTALRDKDADYLVKNILDPNAIIEPRFVNYQVQLADKRWLSGVMKAESATSLTLAAGNGVSETVARSDVKTIKASTTSMMPEGFEGAFTTPQQMADLVAYLKQSAARKELAGNTPMAVKPDETGTLMLPATRAEIFGGGPIMLESEFQNIGYWHGAADYVAWTVELPKTAEFDVFFDYACEDASAGNTFAVDAGGGRAITGVVAGTGPDWTRYVQKKVGTLRLEAGRSRIVVRPDGAAIRGALLDLRRVALAPPGTQIKWNVAKRQAAAAASSDGLARTPAAVAAVILDSSKSHAAREAAVNANPQFAAELIVELTRDLAPDDAKIEYQRIPWIWRVAIAAGKRNDAATLKRMLDASLPKADEPLRDWQAVVIGGGIINGISQQGVWPADRISEILGDDAALKTRWQRALDLSSAMADNEKTPPGTRYDALRMLGVEPWTKRGEQLTKYLTHANVELQMGAVSALVDVKSPEAAKALEAALPSLTENNRKLAAEGLKRQR